MTRVALWGVSPVSPGLQARLAVPSGRPLFLSADPSASLWASGALGAPAQGAPPRSASGAPSHRGVAAWSAAKASGSDALDQVDWADRAAAHAGAVGRLVREAPAVLAAHYAAEVASGVDVLCAATAETTSWALGRVGMEHRAALLTGVSVELAQEAAAGAGRPVAVAGWLEGACLAAPNSLSLMSELALHAERLVQAGCELLLVRGVPAEARPRLLAQCGRAGLPVWIVGEPQLESVARPPAEQVAALWAAGAGGVMGATHSDTMALAEALAAHHPSGSSPRA